MKKVIFYILIISTIVLSGCGNKNQIVGDYKGSVELDETKLPANPIAVAILKSEMDNLVLEFNFNKNRTGYNYIEIMNKKGKVPFVWDYVNESTVKVIIPGKDTLVLQYLNGIWSGYSDTIEGTITLTKKDGRK